MRFGAEKRVAAEFVVRNAEDVRRRFAHGEQRVEMGREFVEAIEIEVEFDETRQSGLIERIGGDRVDESLAGVFFSADVDEALRKGEEVFGPKVRLVKVARQHEATAVVVVQSKVGDRLKAADHEAEAGVPVGIFAREIAGCIKGVAEVARDDQRFHGENGVRFPSGTALAREFGQTARQRNVTAGGGKIGQREQCNWIGGEIANESFGLTRDEISFAGELICAQKIQAWRRK